MARQFGIISATSGVAGIIITSFNRSSSSEVAEARNEQGKIIDLKAYSKGEKIQINGLLDTADFTFSAGDILTIGEKQYLIESAEITESNTGFAGVSVSARTADNTEISVYSAAE